MESFPLNLMSCAVLWALLEAFTSSWLLKHCRRAACEGVLSYISQQYKSRGLKVLYCALSRAQTVKWSRLSTGEGAGCTPCSFSMASHGQKLLLFPLKGSCGCWGFPGSDCPAQLSLLPRSPSAQGILEPVLKDKGILFSTMGSLWEMGWDCSAAQWIKILDILSSLAGGAQRPSSGRPHQVAKPKWKSNFFLCLWGQMWLFSHFSVV